MSMGFSTQEYWRGLPFPSLGDLPDPGIELESPALQADSLPLNHQGSPQIDQLIFQGQFPELLYLFLFHYRSNYLILTSNLKNNNFTVR